MQRLHERLKACTKRFVHVQTPLNSAVLGAMQSLRITTCINGILQQKSVQAVSYSISDPCRSCLKLTDADLHIGTLSRKVVWHCLDVLSSLLVAWLEPHKHKLREL